MQSDNSCDFIAEALEVREAGRNRWVRAMQSPANACQAPWLLACVCRATSSSGTSSFAGHPRRNLRYGSFAWLHGCATELQSRWHNTGTNTVPSSLHCACGHTHAEPEPLQGQKGRGRRPGPPPPTSTAPSFHPPCHTRSLPHLLSGWCVPRPHPPAARVPLQATRLHDAHPERPL